MEIKEMFKISFKSKNDDRGDYQFYTSARNPEKALEKVMRKIEKYKVELKDLTDDYYMLNEDFIALIKKCESTEDWQYYNKHYPTVEYVGGYELE